MAKFIISPTTAGEEVNTVRLGSNTVAAGGGLNDKDVGKAVKLVGESRFGLCAAGDKIEGFISSVNLGVYDGYSIGGITDDDYKRVTFNGTQGEQATTPATALAIGDLVVAAASVAAGIAQSTVSPHVQVCKATTQTIAGFAWRVVSLGSAGTGAVGTDGVIERV